MIQGTGSDVGKSVVVAALCRLFVRQGLRVAPFKAQNMSNNSFVTADGKELGRAQAMQAMASRIPPRADFNPLLIKPSDERTAQLVVNGEVSGNLVASDFGRIRREYADIVQQAFERLAEEFDLIILEGAGSPAEVNLRDYDVVNMHMARVARAPVLLVGDIDRGGVLAALVGTMALLTPEEQVFVKGFMINKFRGDPQLLMPGLRIVEQRTSLPCVGILPYCRELRLPQEDALQWERFAERRRERSDKLRIGIADVPCISNFTDFDALAEEPDVELLRVDGKDTELDVIIFPGTKNTPQALRYVKERGMDRAARHVLATGGMVIGLCGGYQILGRRIRDPLKIESEESELAGLGLLDVETCFAGHKVTIQVAGIHRESHTPIHGYEVHMGRTVMGEDADPLLELHNSSEGSTRSEGAVSKNGRVFGTYVHGLFDSPSFRRAFLNRLRAKRGWCSLEATVGNSLDQELDRWADFVGAHVDLSAIQVLVRQGLSPD